MLTQALKCDSKDDLCFTAKDLKKVQETRTAEKQKAQEAAAKEDALYKEIMSSDGSQSGSSSVSGSKSGKSGSSSKVKTCTIQIRCDSILKHMGDLNRKAREQIRAGKRRDPGHQQGGIRRWRNSI